MASQPWYRQAVPKQEVLSVFASAPVISVAELHADLDDAVTQEVPDPYGRAGQ